MKKAVFVVNKSLIKDQFVYERNLKFIHYLTDFLKWKIVDNYQEADYFFINDIIDQEEAQNSKIPSDPNRIYGAITNKLFSKKSIFHLPIPNTKDIPSHFPFQFAKNMQKLALPGYSVFSIKDALKAYKLLKAKGYTVRYKTTWDSGLDGQYILHSIAELQKILKDINLQELQKYGIILEKNLLKHNTYSGGWSIINGKRYTYVGEQHFGQVSYRSGHSYLGTTLWMVKGDEKMLASQLSPQLNVKYKKVISKLAILYKSISLLPNSIITRCNFDFICDNSNDKADVFILEQSFRFGGATGAEFIAYKLLNTGKKIAKATCKMFYGKENADNTERINEIMFCEEIHDPVYGHIQIWGEFDN